MNEQAIETKVANEAPSATPAYLLWFLVGPFGGYRFYLGYKSTAIWQLILSCTFFGLIITIPWCLVDVFRIGGMCKRERHLLRLQYQAEANNSKRGSEDLEAGRS